VYTCNPSTQEVEAGGYQVRGQPRLYSETLYQKQTYKQKIIVRKSPLTSSKM
jgi:hypothetical protein